MYWLFDVILLLVIVSTIAKCWSRGFVRSLFDCCKTILALIAARLFGPAASAFVAERFMGEKITGAVREKLYEILESTGVAEMDVAALFESLPEAFVNLIKACGADPEALAESFAGTVEASGGSVDRLADALASPVVNLVSNVIGYLAVFVIAYFFFWIVAFVLDKICKLPLLYSFNKLFGLIFGVGLAFVDACLIAYAITLILQLIGTSNSALSPTVVGESTKLYRFFCNIDILGVFRDLMSK